MGQDQVAAPVVRGRYRNGVPAFPAAVSGLRADVHIPEIELMGVAVSKVMESWLFPAYLSVTWIRPEPSTEAVTWLL